MSIDVSARLANVLAGRTFRMVCRATITRGGEVLARDLPVETGREECDSTLLVPERVTVQIPRVVNGVDWSADGVDSPIMPFGQRLHIKIGIGVGPDGYEWINRGEFLIHDVDFTGPRITINAVGLLALVDEALLISPFKLTGSLLSCVRRLVEPALTVAKTSTLTDLAVNTGLIMDDNRLRNVWDLLDSWPARAQVHPEGYLQLLPAEEYGTATGEGMEVQQLHTDTTVRPNVVQVSSSATRDGFINAMVVRGKTNSGAPIQGVAYDTSGGPASYGGPFNPLPIPGYYERALVQSKNIALLLARIHLRKRQAPYRRAWRVDAVPQPRFLMNDQITYRPGNGPAATTIIEKLVMPYTAASGAMQLTIRELPDD